MASERETAQRASRPFPNEGARECSLRGFAPGQNSDADLIFSVGFRVFPWLDFFLLASVVPLFVPSKSSQHRLPAATAASHAPGRSSRNASRSASWAGGGGENACRTPGSGPAIFPPACPPG